MIIFNTILFWVASFVVIFGGIFINLFFIKEIVSEIRSMIIYRRNFSKKFKKNCRRCKKCSCLFTDIEHTKAQMQNYKPGGIWEPLPRMPRHVSSFDFKVFTDNYSVFVRDNVTIDNFEEFIRISREGHDISVLLESVVAEQAEHDSELKKKYEEVKASPDYIPPEERLKRPGVHIDEQRPSSNEDNTNEEI